jgi:hypothetical protein
VRLKEEVQIAAVDELGDDPHAPVVQRVAHELRAASAQISRVCGANERKIEIGWT